jgi:hypothetical protein
MDQLIIGKTDKISTMEEEHKEELVDSLEREMKKLITLLKHIKLMEDQH